jgi:hypothetical protein
MFSDDVPQMCLDCWVKDCGGPCGAYEEVIKLDTKIRAVRKAAERYNNTWSEDMRTGTISAKILEIIDNEC